MSMQATQPDRRVAITGTGLVTSLGLSRDETWANILAGRSGLGALNALEQLHDPARGGGQAMDLPEADEIAANDSKLSREGRYLRHAIRQAVGEAGLSADALPCDATRCGIILGTTLHGMRSGGAFLRSNDPDDLAHFLAPLAIEQAAGELGFKGIATTTCSACSSGLAAVALAVSLLRAGELDLVIAGGYDVISEYAYAGFMSLRLVTDGPLRPFCRDRDGMKLGEGFGIVVLERAADATARHTRAMGYVLGCGESADAHHLTQPHPEGLGARLAIERALADAGVGPDAIGLISAHATSTPDNDVGEYHALAHAFGDGLSHTPIVAFKSHLGHTLGGAGAVELVLTTKALEERIAPPTANVSADRIEYPGLQLQPTASAVPTMQHSLNLSMGFGGANTSVVIGRGEVAAEDGAAKPHAPAIITRSSPGKVCVAGVGVVMPGAVGNQAFITHLSRRDPQPMLRECDATPDAELADLLDLRRARRMSPYVKLSLAATAVAFSDAGLSIDEGQATASMLGTCHGSISYSEAYYREVVERGLDAGNPMYFAEGVPNAAAAHLSHTFQLRGSSQTIIGSRTAALEAMRLAATRIAAGEVDRVVISTAEELTPVVREAYRHCGLYGGGAVDGGGVAFLNEGGFACTSGAVTLILESQRSAEARAGQRDTPYRAVLDRCQTAVAPAYDRRQIVRTLRRLCDMLNLTPDAGVLTSANATWVDQAEAIALAGSGATVSTMYGHIGEAFAVTPLAGIAAVLLTGRLPRLLTPDAAALADQLRALRAATGDESIDRLAVLCTDYRGLLAATAMTLVTRPADSWRTTAEVSA